MRVLYAADTVLPSRSANSLQSMKMVEALSQRGAIVEFAFRRLEDSTEAVTRFYGVQGDFVLAPATLQRDVAGSWRFAARVTARLMGWGSRARIDALYTRSEKVALVATLARRPIVVELHRPFRLPLLRWVVRRTRRVHVAAISEAIRQAVILQTGISVDRIVLARSASAAQGDGPAVDRFRLNPDRALRVGYVGHLYAGKGLEVVLPLAERCPWAEFVVLGGEPSDVVRWRGRASALPNVALLGHRAPSEVDAVLATLDVGLLPNQQHVRTSGSSEGDIARWTSPMKAFDYMAWGVAIIASDQPSLQEFLTDRETALFCAPDDVADWVLALTELRDDVDLRASIGQRAQSIQRERFTWDARADIVLRRLEEMRVGSA